MLLRKCIRDPTQPSHSSWPCAVHTETNVKRPALRKGGAPTTALMRNSGRRQWEAASHTCAPRPPCPQTVEDYMDVLLAHLDALRHRAAPATPGSAAGANGGSVSAEELRSAFTEAASTLAMYWPTYLDRLLRCVLMRTHVHVWVWVCARVCALVHMCRHSRAHVISHVQQLPPHPASCFSNPVISFLRVAEHCPLYQYLAAG